MGKDSWAYSKYIHLVQSITAHRWQPGAYSKYGCARMGSLWGLSDDCNL